MNAWLQILLFWRHYNFMGTTFEYLERVVVEAQIDIDNIESARGKPHI